MDDIAKYNIERWKALAEANALFTRPHFDLDAEAARYRLDPGGILGDMVGKKVLCLAGGGGQQSAAFGLLGAHVTVFDLSEDMLQRDREAAAYYGLDVTTVQGDMRDLSQFSEDAFDIVWRPYSLNFVPDARAVFREVARVLRNDGLYHFNCANPFFSGMTEDDWNGQGYLLRRPYIEGQVITYKDQRWVYDASNNAGEPIPGAREYRHTLSTLVNGLFEHGLVIVELSEQMSLSASPTAEPGTWDHFTAVAPPWLAFWASYRPQIVKDILS